MIFEEEEVMQHQQLQPKKKVQLSGQFSVATCTSVEHDLELNHDDVVCQLFFFLSERCA